MDERAKPGEGGESTHQALKSWGEHHDSGLLLLWKTESYAVSGPLKLAIFPRCGMVSLSADAKEPWRAFLPTRAALEMSNVKDASSSVTKRSIHE